MTADGARPQFRLLGPFEVSAGDVPLDLGGPKQRAVLAALLVEANLVVPLDRLIDELWDDEPPPQATASIQAYISNLRRALEPARPPRTPARVLVTHPPGYVLRVRPDDVDARAFETLAAEGQSLVARGRPGVAREVLARALALWRGPVLADLAHLPFVRAEATRLEELRLAALENRIEADLALGNHAGVIGELESLIARHPYRERLRACLLLALYRSGRQADALNAYQAARVTFADELGIDPGPELQRLEGDILRQAPSLEWRPPADDAPVTSAAPTTDRARQRPPSAEGATLLGRGHALQRLRAVLDEVAAGHGRLFLVSGDPGIGKTRLAEEFAAEAARRGARVAWGRCVEGEAAPAFWPWTQAFRRLLATTGGHGERTDPTDLAELLPELVPADEEAQARAWRDPVVVRGRLHDAAVRWLDELSAEQPVLIVLDDLQWADGPSLGLLHFLTTQVGDLHVLLLGIHRDVDLAPDAPLTQTLGALLRERVVDGTSLRGFSDDEVREFIVRAAVRAPPPDVVTAISRRTGGNPFFLSQLVRLLDSERSAGDWGAALQAVPSGVRDVIRRRLARLPAKTGQLLTIAAVVGPEFDLPVLEDVAGISPDEALDHVEAALITGLLLESDDAVERYRFVHDLVRETLATEISRARRGRVHAAIADALERLYGADSADRVVELATHMWEGARHLPPDRVVATLLRSAEQSAGQLAYEDAHIQLQRAASHVDQMPSGQERDELELAVQLRLGLLTTVTRGLASREAETALDRARGLLKKTTATGDIVVAALWGSVASRAGRCDFDGALEIASELLDVGRRTSDPTATMTGHQSAGIAYLHTGRLAEAAESFAAAASLADAVATTALLPLMQSDPRVVSRASLALVHALRGSPDLADVLNQEALELALALDHPFTEALALSHAARLAAITGDAPRALEHARALAAVASRNGYPQYGAGAGFIEGWALVMSGHRHDGVAQIRDATERFTSMGARISFHFFLALLAGAELSAGHLSAAVEASDRGLRFCETYGERFYESELHRLRGEVLLRQHPAQPDAAVQSFNAAVAVARAQDALLLEQRAVSSLRGV